MARTLTRRRLVAALPAVVLSGCSGRDDDPAQASGEPTDTPHPTETESPAPATPTATELPTSCPTTQGLDVDWPSEFDPDSIASFVEAYERVYYREVVVEYHQETQLDSYRLEGAVTDDPRAVGDGYVLTYEGGGALYRPNLRLVATARDSDHGAAAIEASDIEDDVLSGLVAEAVETGEATTRLERHDHDIDRYVDRFDSYASGFSLSGPGSSASFEVAVDSSTVEVTGEADRMHGDYGWSATYYVDERVVRRTIDEGTDPRDGELLECRAGE